MKFFGLDKKVKEEEHAEVEDTLDRHERRLDELKTRLDNLQKRVEVMEPK